MGVLPAIAILAYYSNSIWRDYSLLGPCIYIFYVHICAAILFFRRLASVLYTGMADPSQIIVFISSLRIVMSGGKKRWQSASNIFVSLLASVVCESHDSSSDTFQESQRIILGYDTTRQPSLCSRHGKLDKHTQLPWSQVFQRETKRLSASNTVGLSNNLEIRLGWPRRSLTSGQWRHLLHDQITSRFLPTYADNINTSRLPVSILKPGPQLDSVTSGWPSSEPIAIILNVIVVHIDIIDFYSGLLRIQ